jgi:cytochrome d ubiquinol oxidase subunit II
MTFPLAFILLTLLLSMYALTDGYDLGVACVTPLIARNERERFAAMRSIRPFWNGNEVWLIAAGGLLFALFPQAYAAAFSGFYLPVMFILWLLVFRGIALEFRNHFHAHIWRVFWDATFSLSSTLLIFIFGVALGNLVRGVPLGSDGYFIGTLAFLLNPYALGVGLLAVITIAQHGLIFFMLRIVGSPAERARRIAVRYWPLLVISYLFMTIATFAVRPIIFHHGPGTMLVPFFALAILFLTRNAIIANHPLRAFLCSCAFIVLLLGATARTMYPHLLLGYSADSGGLNVNAATPPIASLTTTLNVSAIGLILVVAYTAILIRFMREKIDLSKT